MHVDAGRRQEPGADQPSERERRRHAEDRDEERRDADLHHLGDRRLRPTSKRSRRTPRRASMSSVGSR
jgi:hypothetical protein